MSDRHEIFGFNSFENKNDTLEQARETSSRLFDCAYQTTELLKKDFKQEGPKMVAGVTEFIKEHPAESAVIGASSLVGAGLLTGAIAFESPWLIGACGAGALTATLGNLGGIFRIKNDEFNRKLRGH